MEADCKLDPIECCNVLLDCDVMDHYLFYFCAFSSQKNLN